MGRKETFTDLSLNVLSMKHIRSRDEIRDMMTLTVRPDQIELQKQAADTPNEVPGDPQQWQQQPADGCFVEREDFVEPRRYRSS